MRQHRILARWFASLLVVGTVVTGAVAPAEAATTYKKSPSAASSWQPADTGWGST
jgi:heme A synthase